MSWTPARACDWERKERESRGNLQRRVEEVEGVSRVLRLSKIQENSKMTQHLHPQCFSWLRGHHRIQLEHLPTELRAAEPRL